MSTRSPWSGPAFGAWCSLGDPYVAESLAHAGFDYVAIDMQHGLIDFRTAISMLIAISGSPSTPVVRVPTNEPAVIGQMLDVGARVVIVPMIESASAAREAVAACRYAPLGNRSFGPTRAVRLAGGVDPSRLNDVAMCLVMIESQAGLDAADEICAVDGLDGVYIGPADLAISLEIPLAEMRSSAEHDAATGRIFAAARKNGITVGHHGVSGSHASSLAARGFDMITVTSDTSCLMSGAARELATARSVR